MSNGDWLLVAGVALVAVVLGGAVYLAWPVRRTVPERTIVDDLRDLESTPDDHPFYEDPPAAVADPLQDPDDDGSSWGEDDYPHDQAVPQVVAAESPDASWMDTVRASMPTPPLDVRRIGDDEDIDPDSVVKGEAVGGNTSWFTPTHELPARPDRVLRPVGRAPALEMAEAMPPLTSWALEKRFNAPKQDEDGEFMPGEVGIFDHSNLTGAFRPWRDVLAEGEGS